MVQLMNLQPNNRFINPTRLYISCEKSGDQHFRSHGRLADEIKVRLEILEAICKPKYLISALFSRVTALLQQV